MNHCNAFASCEEIRRENLSVFGERRESVVCPKPRRLELHNPGFYDPVWPLRWQLGHPTEMCESKAGTDVLDIILLKGGYGVEQSYGQQVASSPPFYCGSPPSRVANPLIQDSRFGDEKFVPVSPRSIPAPSGLAAPSPSSCVRANFGNSPAVRIEGFNCMGRDNRRNCSIPALA